MCYGNLGCTIFWATVIYYVNVISRSCDWGSICLYEEFCGVSYQCNFGVDCHKRGYSVFILILYGSYVNSIVLVDVIFSVMGSN